MLLEHYVMSQHEFALETKAQDGVSRALDTSVEFEVWVTMTFQDREQGSQGKKCELSCSLPRRGTSTYRWPTQHVMTVCVGVFSGRTDDLCHSSAWARTACAV